MARPSKENKEKKEKEDSTAVVTVNIDDFTRTRDSVIISLATLQSAVSDLSRAYINHANTILNRGPATLDLGSSTSMFENGILANAQAAIAAGAAGALGGAGAAQDESGEQKKRKRKRVHDPNAPKRALTPYFLYMKINRPLIAKELGETAKPKDIADEGARRWGAMSESEKQVWKDKYQANLAVYHEKMKAYKAGQTVPEDDEAAQQLQQGIDNAAESSSEVSSSSEEEESSPEPEPEPEPVKEPTPPRQKRRRTLEAKNAAVESTPAKKGSPEKKKKSKAGEEKLQKAAVAETPKSEKKKRKRKSQAHVEED